MHLQRCKCCCTSADLMFFQFRFYEKKSLRLMAAYLRHQLGHYLTVLDIYHLNCDPAGFYETHVSIRFHLATANYKRINVSIVVTDTIQ